MCKLILDIIKLKLEIFWVVGFNEYIKFSWIKSVNKIE